MCSTLARYRVNPISGVGGSWVNWVTVACIVARRGRRRPHQKGADGAQLTVAMVHIPTPSISASTVRTTACAHRGSRHAFPLALRPRMQPRCLPESTRHTHASASGGPGDAGAGSLSSSVKPPFALTRNDSDPCVRWSSWSCAISPPAAARVLTSRYSNAPPMEPALGVPANQQLYLPTTTSTVQSFNRQSSRGPEGSRLYGTPTLRTLLSHSAALPTSPHSPSTSPVPPPPSHLSL